jgi:ABC-type amino acid transport substrate-binding protein
VDGLDGAILALEHWVGSNRDKISLIAAGDQSVLAQALMAGTIDVTVLDGVMTVRCGKTATRSLLS